MIHLTHDELTKIILILFNFHWANRKRWIDQRKLNENDGKTSYIQSNDHMHEKLSMSYEIIDRLMSSELSK